jgi:hypothetical protein
VKVELRKKIIEVSEIKGNEKSHGGGSRERGEFPKHVGGRRR